MVTTRSRTTSEAVTPTRASHADGPGSAPASGRTTRSRRGSTPLASPLGSPAPPLSPRTRARASATASAPDSASKLRYAVDDGSAPRTRASRSTEVRLEFGESEGETSDEGDAHAEREGEDTPAATESSDGIEIISPPVGAHSPESTLDNAADEGGDDVPGDDDDDADHDDDDDDEASDDAGNDSNEEAKVAGNSIEPSLDAPLDVSVKSTEEEPESTPAKKRTRTPRTSAAAHDAARAILGTPKSPASGPKDTVEVVLDAPRRGSKRASLAKGESPAKAAKVTAGDSPRAATANGTKASPKTKGKASPRASKSAADAATTGSGGGASARRRARQKDRIRALRAAAGVPLAAVDNETAARLDAALRALLADKADDESVCASRAARAVASEAHGEAAADWEALLPATRAVVLDLVKSRALALVTGDPSPDAAGQLRVRRGARF